MKTELFDAQSDSEAVLKATELMRAGELIAFPTETVYGLGASVWNADQVQKIFTAKNRPQDNPLIAHVADVADLDKLVENVPQHAKKLIDEFWPGPLTLLFQKKSEVPDIVTAGLQTICVRMPDHPIARQLIAEVGAPLVAPSANLSGKPSPTKADHVIQDMDGRIAGVLDAGPTEVGIESTVLDVISNPPRILRPGVISATDIERVLGVMPVQAQEVSKGVQSPGVKYRHYAPEADVMLIYDWQELTPILEMQAVENCLLLTSEALPQDVPSIVQRPLLTETLYSELRDADAQGKSHIIVFVSKDTELQEGLMNRLKKASQK